MEAAGMHLLRARHMDRILHRPNRGYTSVEVRRRPRGAVRRVLGRVCLAAVNGLSYLHLESGWGVHCVVA